MKEEKENKKNISAWGDIKVNENSFELILRIVRGLKLQLEGLEYLIELEDDGIQ